MSFAGFTILKVASLSAYFRYSSGDICLEFFATRAGKVLHWLAPRAFPPSAFSKPVPYYLSLPTACPNNALYRNRYLGDLISPII